MKNLRKVSLILTLVLMFSTTLVYAQPFNVLKDTNKSELQEVNKKKQIVSTQENKNKKIEDKIQKKFQTLDTIIMKLQENNLSNSDEVNNQINRRTEKLVQSLVDIAETDMATTKLMKQVNNNIKAQKYFKAMDRLDKVIMELEKKEKLLGTLNTDLDSFIAYIKSLGYK